MKGGQTLAKCTTIATGPWGRLLLLWESPYGLQLVSETDLKIAHALCW